MSNEKDAARTIDARILDALQHDGRMSNRALAAHVGLSPSACLERVRKLQARGVIRAYAALVDAHALGLHFETWAMLTLPARRCSQEVLDLLARNRFVCGAWTMVGPFDALVHIVAPDVADWRKLEAELSALGVSARIAIVMDELKPLTQLATPDDFECRA